MNSFHVCEQSEKDECKQPTVGTHLRGTPGERRRNIAHIRSINI